MLTPTCNMNTPCSFRLYTALHECLSRYQFSTDTRDQVGRVVPTSIVEAEWKRIMEKISPHTSKHRLSSLVRLHMLCPRINGAAYDQSFSLLRSTSSKESITTPPSNATKRPTILFFGATLAARSTALDFISHKTRTSHRVELELSWIWKLTLQRSELRAKMLQRGRYSLHLPQNSVRSSCIVWMT